ncbi:hypothetical protein DL767_003149 [Monosporascus sp. MG133]|nr:hypothetical protein DL767_003149 [Monosporascus sp. MG133]
MASASPLASPVSPLNSYTVPLVTWRGAKTIDDTDVILTGTFQATEYFLGGPGATGYNYAETAIPQLGEKGAPAPARRTVAAKSAAWGREYLVLSCHTGGTHSGVQGKRTDSGSLQIILAKGEARIDRLGSDHVDQPVRLFCADVAWDGC